MAVHNPPWMGMVFGGVMFVVGVVATLVGLISTWVTGDGGATSSPGLVVAMGPVLAVFGALFFLGSLILHLLTRRRRRRR